MMIRSIRYRLLHPTMLTSLILISAVVAIIMGHLFGGIALALLGFSLDRRYSIDQPEQSSSSLVTVYDRWNKPRVEKEKLKHDLDDDPFESIPLPPPPPPPPHSPGYTIVRR